MPSQEQPFHNKNSGMNMKHSVHITKAPSTRTSRLIPFNTVLKFICHYNGIRRGPRAGEMTQQVRTFAVYDEDLPLISRIKR